MQLNKMEVKKEWYQRSGRLYELTKKKRWKNI